MNRRNLLKALSVVPALGLAPSIAFGAHHEEKKKATDKAKKAKGGAPKNLLSETDGLGKAMQYKHEASKAGPIRSNKKALCNNCAKWNVCNEADKTCKPGKATAAHAPCSVFPGKVVANKGWCLSWQAKG